MREVDGSYGEGGGQLVRTAVALAAITGTPIDIRRMRARRAKPGLAPQHVTAVRAVAEVCDATVDGLAAGSQRLVFTPGRTRGGTYAFDVGTAGSTPLVLQALLPVLIASGERASVRLTGGTDIWAAPPLDYVVHVLLPLLGRLGARATLRCVRRGYYPRGGGLIEVLVEPGRLVPQAFDAQGKLRGIRGVAHAANLPAHVAERMRIAAVEPLSRWGEPHIDAEVLGPSQAIGAGGAVVLWAETAHTVLGAGRVARRGVRAEVLGHDAGAELAADLQAGATLDPRAADQMLIYFALCGGGSFLTRVLTTHAETTLWLIEQFLPVRFSREARGALVRVEVLGRGSSKAVNREP